MNAHPKYRADVDGLRAVAVTAVLIFHAFPRQLPGGYIGVDIFFVISGFLITSIIVGGLERGSFSFRDFYARRVRRIFPALLVVLACSFAFGWLVLMSDEFASLGKQIAGGAGFASNLLLWSESGYFDSASDFKPLLHLWSLGIEEQFYLFWPFILWAIYKQTKNFSTAVTLALAASFLFSIWQIQTDTVAAFYSPLTRFWELLVGALLACRSSSQTQAGIETVNVKAWVGIVLILAGMISLTKESIFPGWLALLPTIGTALIISAGPTAWVNRNILASKPFVGIGLISYPLYLWHWPLLSYANIIEAGEPGKYVRLIALGSSLILAWLTYTILEKRIRRVQSQRDATVGLISLMILVGAAGFATYLADGIQSRKIAIATVEISKARVDFINKQAEFGNNKLDINRVSFSGQSDETTLFVGDSMMGHYIHRIETLYSQNHIPDYSSVFASRAGCRPIPYGASINSGEHCDEYFRAIMELAKEERIKRIVFSASWESIFSTRVDPKNYVELERLLTALKHSGKTLYFIANTPRSEQFDPLQIAKPIRMEALLNEASKKTNAALDRRIPMRDKGAHEALRALAAKVGATMIDPFDYLCNKVDCPYLIQGVPLYLDGIHIRASVAQERAVFLDGLLKE